MTPNTGAAGISVLPWVMYLITLSTSVLVCKTVMVLPPAPDIMGNI